ncbi:MAG: hypothetical protein K8T26_16700 [Lentisphaerae bacterium]|nr:hypothetical protein [Lentisphaerota bacterium]
MTALSCGERLVRCLIGEPVDRPPFGVGLGWYPWGETAQRWRRESGNPNLDHGRELAYEPDFAVTRWSDGKECLQPGIFPHFERVVIREDADTITVRDERGITKRDRRDGGSMPEFLDYPVKTPDDWQRLKAERLNPHTPGRITMDWDAFRARIKATGQAVQVGWFPYGVFGTPRDFMGAEEVLIAFCTEPAMIKDMMQHLTTLWLHLWEQVARDVQIDHIHIWEDMSGRQGSLISPAMVESFMMPCYDRIVDFARAHGIRIVSVDTDGDCRQLVPIMMKHGINMMFPFEVQAGNDVREFRRQYPALGMMGGLDKRALAGTHADIDAEVDKAAWVIANGGRYVPAFDHLIPPDVPWENMQYAARALRKLCLSAAS